MKQREALSAHRFKQALSCLRQAQILVAANEYKGAANRSYYAVFHAVRSVLALEGIDFGKHTAVMAHFRKAYIRTKIFDENLSDILTLLFKVRNDSDYDDFYVINKEDVANQLSSAEYFLSEIRQYIDKSL
ncbi:MAG: HEPN domain-containing protein [Defluviitaleaceae bacterium]|nr:HEPN domain-containing protein [Defluviitaleaceae bacterium]MCL2273673.1 HEPN domain-containing protein [Defluviitaleaceae bacterium]